jgi:hypothetical protein
MQNKNDTLPETVWLNHLITPQNSLSADGGVSCGFGCIK